VLASVLDYLNTNYEKYGNFQDSFLLRYVVALWVIGFQTSKGIYCLHPLRSTPVLCNVFFHGGTTDNNISFPEKPQPIKRQKYK
jgi:hypothetical protein